MEDEMGKRIEAARRRAGLTRGDLARRLSVSRRTLLRWETDLGRPGPEELSRLAGILETAPSALTGRAEEAAGRPIDPPAVRRAKLLFPWFLIPGAVLVCVLIGCLILTEGRAAAREPLPAAVLEAAALAGSGCRDFGPGGAPPGLREARPAGFAQGEG